MKRPNSIILAVVVSVLAASLLFFLGSSLMNEEGTNDESSEQAQLTEEFTLSDDSLDESFNSKFTPSPKPDPITVVNDLAPHSLIFEQGDSAAETEVFNQNLELVEQIRTELPFLDTRNNWRFCNEISADFNKDEDYVVDYYSNQDYACTDIVEDISIQSSSATSIDVPTQCFSARYLKYIPTGYLYFAVPVNEDLNTQVSLRYGVNGEEYTYDQERKWISFNDRNNIFELEVASLSSTINFTALLEDGVQTKGENPLLRTPAQNACQALAESQQKAE